METFGTFGNAQFCHVGVGSKYYREYVLIVFLIVPYGFNDDQAGWGVD
ncbi:MAG TPA: hypothetical protein VMW20_01400 [Candidatus Nanoarchaeia archaeon]|nr:hypothetical protein [Candidatus Nanoarchaeia archaeon]